MIRRALALLTAAPLLAAGLAGSAAAAPSKAAPSAAGYPDTAFRSMEFRLVGPFRGGRVTAVAGDPTGTDTFYMGSTGGGVWKTTDGGLTWRNVSDKVWDVDPEEPPAPMGEAPTAEAVEGKSRREKPRDAGAVPAADTQKIRPGDVFGAGSIGAITVAPSDPNVIYVGTGSACIRGNVSPGDGMYKSTDAGATWHHVGLPEAGQIARIHVHPNDPDLVYAAVFGHAFGANPERGVYRSRDGGATWQRVLFVSETAGAIDLAMDPSNPRVLYAATWEAVRKPWTMISGGPGSGLFKSTDGGDTWRKLTEGLPEETLGRIGVAVSPANPNRVWALVEAKEKPGLYRSDDGGKSFRLVNGDRDLVQRAWYYTHVFADPQDASTVYVLNVAMMKSEDGGRSFSPIRTPHGDNHDLWIHPADPRVMIEGNDGGANVSINGGRTWTGQENQPTAEMYRVTVDDQWPYWLYSGQQDNSAVAIPSAAPGGGIGREDWYVPGGCESAWVAVDPEDADVTYAGCYGGTIGRFDRKIGFEQERMAYPEMAVGQRASDLKYRFQWNAPIKTSPHDPNVVYHTSNFVHRSTDEGMTWQVISPDLTRDDESKQDYAGGDLTWDNTGVEVYGTIFDLVESPHAAGELWAGSDDGLVHLSRDDGATWQNVTPQGMPEWATVNAIELSPRKPGRALIAVQRYRLDDFRPYIFLTEDWGASWRLLTDGKNGIPADHFTRVVREDPEREGLLFAGTEFGLYASVDDGRSWFPFQLNLPVTPVTDLRVKRGDLVVATQGRSFWILDDLTPLRGMGSEALAADAHLFAPRPAIQWEGVGSGWGGGDGGENPPYGAVIWYHLANDLTEKDAPELVMEILDANGEVLRKLSSQKEEPAAPNPWARYFPGMGGNRKLAAEEGLNRYVWSFQLPDAYVVDDAVLWGIPQGPEVPPGAYQVRLTLGDWSETQPLTIAKDPRIDADEAAMAGRFELSKQIWEAISESHRALARSRSVRAQVNDVVARLAKPGEDAPAEVKEAADALTTKLKEIEDELHQSKSTAGQDILNFPPQIDNQLLFLMGVVESTAVTPTEGAKQRWNDLRSELDGYLARLDAALETELPAFNQAVQAAMQGGPVIVPEITDETPGTKTGR